MEEIKFKYTYSDNEEENVICMEDSKKVGSLDVFDMCEKFLNFMVAVGFSRESVKKYFREINV